jgi:hypothetical protein
MLFKRIREEPMMLPMVDVSSLPSDILCMRAEKAYPGDNEVADRPLLEVSPLHALSPLVCWRPEAPRMNS